MLLVDVEVVLLEVLELVELLDQQVRALVRREGVDPQLDAPIVRRIAEGVVRDHDRGQDVSSLDYSVHPTAQARLTEVAGLVAQRSDAVRVAALHRSGATYARTAAR